MAAAPLVGIVMGSASDLGVMSECAKVLEGLGVPYEIRVLSAHRTPADAARYAQEAAGRGLRVLVGAAGGAAHLAGALAAHSLLPVIGVPVDSTPLAGFDSLLSTVQMPPGIPVACVAVGKFGAANAGHLAAQVIALSDPALAGRVAAARAKLADDARAADAGIAEKLRELLGR